MKAAFSLANDISHSGGYVFNSSGELIDLLSILAYRDLWKFMASETLLHSAFNTKNRNEDGLDSSYLFFKGLMDAQEKEIQRILDSIKADFNDGQISINPA